MSTDLFGGIIGHNTACEFLRRMVERGSLAHAYLFLGPENVGKTTVVHELIKSLFPAIAGPQQMESHPDIVTLNRLADEKTGHLASSVSVEQIRDLRERLSMSSFLGGHKVAFIEDAEFMNMQAANALLKTLEEPTKETMLILRASALEKIPETIISRCQVIRFNLVPRDMILQKILESGLSESDALQIASMSAGRPGVALKLMRGSEERAEAEVAVGWFCEFASSNMAARLREAAELLPKKDESHRRKELIKLFNRWERVGRDAFLVSIGLDNLVAHPAFLPDLKKLTEKKPAGHWARVVRTIQEARSAVHQNVNVNLSLESFLIAL